MKIPRAEGPGPHKGGESDCRQQKTASAHGSAPEVIVGMCIIGLIGSLMSVLLGWMERRALPWRTPATGP